MQDRSDELFNVIGELPKGLVDVFVGGHTHAMVAHRIDDVAVIESYSSGRAFGRVDLRLTDTHVSGVTIHQPQLLCPLDKDRQPGPVAECHPAPYEGKPVVADAEVQTIADEAIARAAKRARREARRQLTAIITKSYRQRVRRGQLVHRSDARRAARRADVALTNGGGLRADIPAGDLTYGRLYEAMPFDNRFAVVELKGKHIRKLVTDEPPARRAASTRGAASPRRRAARTASSTPTSRSAASRSPTRPATRSSRATSSRRAETGVIGRLKLPEGSMHADRRHHPRRDRRRAAQEEGGKVDPTQLSATEASRLRRRRPVELRR